TSFILQVRRNGPYDVIHCHIQHFSGIALLLGKMMSVTVGVAHSHLDSSRAERSVVGMRKIYLRIMESAIKRLSTQRLAVSRFAAASLFGTVWEILPNTRILYCGLDLEA